MPTVWLTGLSAAGKTTLARALAAALRARGTRAVVIDGDALRARGGRLGFTPAARGLNARRAVTLARRARTEGAVAIVALVSPFARDRAAARRGLGGRVLEVWVDAPLALCARRDPKGLYRRARAGRARRVAGVDAPYEAPRAPALRLPTGRLGRAECVRRLLAAIDATP